MSIAYLFSNNDRQFCSCLPDSDAYTRLSRVRILDMNTSAGFGVPGCICAGIDLKDSIAGAYKNCSADCTHNVERKRSAAAVNSSLLYSSPEELS